MNKTEYLRKKGLLPLDMTPMYVIHSTRTSIRMYELPIWEIETLKKSTRYKFKEAPYELEIENAMKYGETHGYGTGCGDLWGWSYYGTFDKEVASSIYDKERLRIFTTYQLQF